MDTVLIVYAYLPTPVLACAKAAAWAGGALIGVSPRAAAAVREHRLPNTGQIDVAVRRILQELDDREGHSTELGLLVRALGRRPVYVREAASTN
jgi:hypothetical protein